MHGGSGQKALEAFHKAAVADRVTCKRLPVRAPYHCAELLSEACAATLQQLADEPPIRASQLKLPCWSCVDGSDISVSGLSTLRGYLVDAMPIAGGLAEGGQRRGERRPRQCAG